MLYPAVIYLWHKFNQRVKIDIRIVIFCVLIYLYFLMIVYIFTYQIYRVDIKSKIIIGVLFFIAVAAVLFIIYILYRKNEEHKKLAAIKELEIARKKESYEYEQLINKIEGMAKIRHDFYDQLSVAKYIGEKDKDKALAMIDELNEKLK
jgi:LytS/YehU family sensor histidine kinase